MTSMTPTGHQATRAGSPLARLRRFNRDRSGAVAILFAVSSVAVVALLGAAFDVSRAMGDKGKVQDAMDQAVLAGAQASPVVRNDVARRLFLANLGSLSSTVSDPTFTTTADGVLHGTVTTVSPTLILSAANITDLTTTETASAKTNATANMVASASLLGQSPADPGLKLKWAPPALVHPTTITLGTGETYTNLDPGKDYIIKLPSTKKVGYTFINGGHNIQIIGGYITIPVSGDTTNDAPSRAIYIKDATGTVHIEGVLIDGSGGGMSDGIDISAPAATVQVENVRVFGIFGFYNEFHADVIQPFGGVKDLRVDMLTGYSGYQGLTLGQTLGPIGSAELSRVNLVSTGAPIYGAGNNGGYLIWLTPSTVCSPAYPVTMTDVYVKPRGPLSNGVWPPVGASTACSSQTTANDAVLTWPTLPVTGYVTKGLPPKGDFVPAGIAGVSYVSPGYQNG